ncbi:MAG TPA: sel1 repeat family protein, partial [Candidatus Cloacimonas sp.]|nr:sel1 repeat family protein [Candidatus Cloacimonas sp.]
VSYANGEGVVKNYKQAVYWYEKAANQGHADAQNNLGVCYEFGKGVVQNYQTAYFWYLLASANGIEKAKDNMD